MGDYEPDTRVDPRIHGLFGDIRAASVPSAKSREELIARAQTADAESSRQAFSAFLDLSNRENVAPSDGLRITERTITSRSEGNKVNLHITRPDNTDDLPCVFYIHGGGMRSMSCYDGNYLEWARILASQGVAVVMVDFRNAITPSSVQEVAPFPAGLNDCLAGFYWTHEHSAELGVDRERIIISGDSGGGNLALACAISLNRSSDASLASGIYAFCAYISGSWPQQKYPSSTENNGIFIDVHGTDGAMAYGIEAYRSSDPLAWPAFATSEDLQGFPPTVISLNECDPLRDEGVEFYRKLLAAGVKARAKIQLGTTHATELIPVACPEITMEAARSFADFCSGKTL